MIHKILPAISIVAVALAFTWPCRAAWPRPISETIAWADLLAETEGRIRSIEESLASDERVGSTRRPRLTGDMALLKILAAAIAESDEQAAAKVAAGDLYRAILAIEQADSREVVVQQIAAARGALSGKSTGASATIDWAALSRSRAIMGEINARNNALRRARHKRPTDTTQPARDASVISLLALVMHEASRRPDDSTYNATWKKHALELRDQSRAAALEMKRGDWDAAGLSLNKANEACTRCHDELRRR